MKKTRKTPTQVEDSLKKAKFAWGNDHHNLNLNTPMKYYIATFGLGNCAKEPLIKYFNDEISLKECHDAIKAPKRAYNEKQRAKKAEEERNKRNFLATVDAIHNLGAEIQKYGHQLVWIDEDHLTFTVVDLVK